MLVSDGDKVDVIFPNTIDDVVRKTRNDPLSEFTTKGRACLRMRGNPIRCLLDGRQESETEPIKPGFIKLDCFAHLRPRIRVEDGLLHDRLFRNSAKTS